MRVLGRALRGLVLILAGTLAGVLVIEFAVRMAPGLLPPGLRLLNRAYRAEVNWPRSMAADDYLGYRMRPGVDLAEEFEGRVIRSRLLALDSLDIGVRDLGLPARPVDAVAIGDSFTFCTTVDADQCWLRLVAEQTGRHIVNLGVPGYSSLAETRMLARYGVPLRPRLILSALFLNDFKENLRFQLWLEQGQGSFLDWIRHQRLSPWVDFLERQSLLYRVARRTLNAYRRDVHRWHGNGGDLRLSGAGWWRDIVDIDERDRAWGLMRQSVLEQKRLAADSGAVLVILLFPFKEQAYWHIVRDFAADGDRCDPDRPYRMITELCRAEGIPVLDLTEAFRARAREGETLYLRDDAHWNEAGNALAGREVAVFLRQQGLASE